MHVNRCAWCEKDDLYRHYHDTEWGVPVHDDAKMFEFLLLETFQAGLSWHTILRKRENFRAAFDDFDYTAIANYHAEKIQVLMQDAGIVRNQMKINASISNAQAFMQVQKEFGSFSKYLWDFVDGKPIVNEPCTIQDVPPRTVLSDTISLDLKKRGFKFVGSTVVYAHLQAVGLVNDHVLSCWKRN